MTNVRLYPHNLTLTTVPSFLSSSTRLLAGLASRGPNPLRFFKTLCGATDLGVAGSQNSPEIKKLLTEKCRRRRS